MNKEEFLAGLDIFGNLTPEEINALAKITREYEYPAGAIIAYQRDVADSLYIVRDGRLEGQRVDEQGIARPHRRYLAGDRFEEPWLFTADTHPATITAAAASRILLIKQADFLKYLDKYTKALAKLQLTPEGWREAQKSRASLARGRGRYAALKLLPDELVEYEARRNRLMFFLRVRGILEGWLPAAGIVFAPLTCWVLLESQFNVVAWGLWAILLPLVPAVFFALLLLFFMADWLNDYFLVTNKHIVHYELSLQSFKSSVHKIPVDRVQSVEVERPNLFATLLNVGTARITTAAQVGLLQFDHITSPGNVKSAINRVNQRVHALDAGRVQAAMRQSVEGHFQVNQRFREIKDESLAERPKTPRFPRLHRLWNKLRNALGYKVVRGDMITYRKHGFVLLMNTWWQVVTIAVLMVLLYFFFPAYYIVIPLLALTGFMGLWLIWNVEDWRNDLYQLTDRFVVDVDRKPFGFGESRKQAELGNVQNVNADRPGLLQTVFNFGNVIIETAGADANFTFENVANPSGIQSELFRRRDQFRDRQRQGEEEQRRQEYAVLLDVYQQAREQAQIPRRTPPAEF